jgi:hypothetical protein
MVTATCPIAVQKISNGGGGAFVGAPWRVVWHTTEGDTIQGGYDALVSKGVEPHFIIDGSQIWQLTPLNVAGRSLQHTSDPQTNRNNAIQIEMVGFAGRPKSQALLQTARKLALWLAMEFGIPWVWPNGNCKPAVNGQDPGGHNRSVAGWAKGGHFGHEHVPENVHWDPAFTLAEQNFVTAPAASGPATPPPAPAKPATPAPVTQPPAPAPGTLPKGTSMANPLFDKLRNFVDQIDNAARVVDLEMDQVENLPFIGAVVAPFGKTVDTILGIVDGIRATVDQLDPPAVPPAGAPIKK